MHAFPKTSFGNLCITSEQKSTWKYTIQHKALCECSQGSAARMAVLVLLGGVPLKRLFIIAQKNVFYNVFAPEICTRPRRRAVGAQSFSQNKIERLLDKPQSMHGIMQYGHGANRPPQLDTSLCHCYSERHASLFSLMPQSLNVPGTCGHSDAL